MYIKNDWIIGLDALILWVHQPLAITEVFTPHAHVLFLFLLLFIFPQGRIL